MHGPYYVFAGGGTGGHLFPGLAVAAALCELQPEANITFFTTSRPLDAELIGRTAYGQVPQPVRPLTMHPLKVPGFLLSWWKSVATAREYLRANRVAAVLGLGGYAAGPPVVAARKLGISTAILNPDAVPGRANHYLASRADLVVMQWEVSRRFLPARANCQSMGCPIRSDFAVADAPEGRRRFELESDRPVLLVTGASQGARSVNEAVVRVWPAFQRENPQWQIVHLAGSADEVTVKQAYAAAGVPAKVLAFTHEMPLALAAADLVISRAGASTLAELTALGRPSILMPYPYHRDRHQEANARVLVEAGAAILIDDRGDTAANEPALRAALARAADAGARRAMAAAAKRLGRGSAATDVARWLTSASQSAHCSAPAS